MLNSQTMASLRDRDNLRKEDKMPGPKVSFVRRLDCSGQMKTVQNIMHGLETSIFDHMFMVNPWYIICKVQISY